MEAMARYRSHSKEFKRQIAQEFLAGATLYGLAKRHHISRQLIRVWVPKYEAGAFHEDAPAADLLHEYEAENAPSKQVERFLDLAQENRTPERTLIVRMAHIYQGKYKNNEIAALISAHDQKQFLTHLAPAFHRKSPFYRTRAFSLTFYLMGIPISLIAEFFLISRRVLRRTIEKYRDGDVMLLLNRPSKGVKKTEDKDLKDRLFAVMHAPPIDYDINRTTWTIDLLKQVLSKDGYYVGHNTLSKIIRA